MIFLYKCKEKEAERDEKFAQMQRVCANFLLANG